MKRINNVDRLFMAFVITLGIFCMPSCEKEPDKPAGGNKIEVSATSIEAVTYSFGDLEATISGYDSNNVNITNHGFYWSTIPDPDLNSSLVELGRRNKFGSFNTRLSDLDENKKYYVRAFANIPGGTILGPSTEFTTLERGPAVVKIDSLSSIMGNSASCFSSVLSDGGYDVTARGVCWNTTGNPTLQNCINFTSDGIGIGSFTSNITGLSPSTTYYVRAYATNSAGTAYGDQKSFTTSPSATVPSVTTANVTNITSTTAISGGNVTSTGGAAVTLRGVCWSTSQNPTIFNAHTSDGSGTGSFVSSLEGLLPSTTYYIRAYATNSQGTAYGNQLSFTTSPTITIPTVTTASVTNITSSTAISGGNVTASGGAAVSARGVCWSTSQNPTLSDSHTTDGSGNGVFVSNLSGLSPSTTYYVKAYATNSRGTAYGNQESFTTTSSGIQCNDFTLTHTAGSVAPVSKTVNYNVALTDLSGETKCWITQNLGADFQATTVNDNSEAAAGWYWQFNRKQGYKHDGTTRTPSTTWISSINENSDWLPANDPCALLLGSGWRLPTNTEWTNADETGGWDNYNETFASVLKLHAAGHLYNGGGSLYNRGSSGDYWSSSQDVSDRGRYLSFGSGYSLMDDGYKAGGGSARCLRD